MDARRACGSQAVAGCVASRSRPWRQARLSIIVLIPGEISRPSGIPFPIVLGYPCPTLDPDGHRATRAGRNDRTVKGDPRMSANENKALVTRFIEEAFNQG